MKFLHIVAGMDPGKGGVTEAVRSMIEGLSPHDIDNEIVSLDSPSDPYILQSKLVIHALGPSKTGWRYSSKVIPWLRQHLEEYDAVIVHGLWQFHVYAVYRVWKKMKHPKPKMFVMPHGMLDPYFQKAEGRRLKAVRNNLFWSFIERHTVNSADAVLFTCETERVLAGKSFRPYNPGKEEVVGLGINPAPVYTSEMRTAFVEKCHNIDTYGCLLYISRIHPKKGVDLLIEAYLKLKINIPSLPKLVIAGPGLDTEYGKQILKMAAADRDIIFTGMLTGDERWGGFYACAALVLPSHQENFGFVVVEAMACGKPVLITDQVNIWREVKNGKAGLVAKDTVDGITQLLSAWSAFTEMEKEEMARNARISFDRYFSLDRSTERLLSVMKSAAS